MSQEVYSGFPASFVHAGGTLTLSQLSGADKSTGKSMMEVVAGGDLDRKAVILSHADPRIGVISADLATILGAVSPSTGLKITGTALLQMQQRASGGAFAGSSANVTVTNTVGGFLSINSIAARQDDNNEAAACELFYYPHSSDGLAVPLTPAISQNLTGSPAFGSQFFLGPVYLGATELEGLVASEVQCGIEYTLQRASGDVFARKGFIKRRRPIIRLTFEKISNIDSSAMFSAALGDTLAVYYWKGEHGGSRVAVASTVHAKISVTAGEWGADNIAWSRDEDGNLVLTVLPTTTLAASVASSIP